MESVDSKTDSVKAHKLWQRVRSMLTKKHSFRLPLHCYCEGLFEKYSDKAAGTTTFTVLQLNSSTANDESSKSEKKPVSVQIYEQKSEISVQEINAFNQKSVDSTGLALWPAEEILAYYLLQRFASQKIVGKQRILELGAGYSGLASLLLARYFEQTGCSSQFQIIVTDGNEDCVQQLKRNLELNAMPADLLSAKQLVWGCQQQEEQDSGSTNSYDLIVISDCLFFKDYHAQLAQTIHTLLSAQNGECIIVAPQRGDSMQKFLDTAKSILSYEFFDFEDQQYTAAKQSLRGRLDAAVKDSADALEQWLNRYDMRFISIKHKIDSIQQQQQQQQ